VPNSDPAGANRNAAHPAGHEEQQITRRDFLPAVVALLNTASDLGDLVCEFPYFSPEKPLGIIWTTILTQPKQSCCTQDLSFPRSCGIAGL
jgi:hypothetical protein